MQTPVQVTFRHMSVSEALEANIKQRVDELESIDDRITSCRVMVEAPAAHHRQGGLYRILIDLGLPGGHIVVGRAPDAHHAHEDVHVAVADAFRAARRQLEDHVARLHERGERQGGDAAGR
jgi:ribosomal subunit interface protein